MGWNFMLVERLTVGQARIVDGLERLAVGLEYHYGEGAAPYVNVTVENTAFKQYKLVNVFLDVIEIQIIEPTEILGKAVFHNFFPQDDGTYKAIAISDLDLASCVTDSSYGLPVLVKTMFSAYYLLNECGKTIQTTADFSKSQYVMVYSHPGFGCKAFPDGPAYNCTVAFTSTSSTFGYIFYGKYFDTAAACDGYSLRVTDGTTLDEDICTDIKIGSGNATITLRGQALAKTFKVGFSFAFWN
ncbi:uncharacterized protein LOC108673010 [Hyalella azteca]|uniref:Uncharacterized protein LOC108673010 n=1 Tax=Hyalella azteca TaxID=294128 RepID=A0A8B7NRF0_HYAAZ|nr:uncharacterized protein LOC108673010 [Hyalella azteca]